MIKKAFLVLLLTMPIIIQLSAQKNSWTIGINAGFKQDINSTSINYRNIVLGKHGFSPQIDLLFSYFFHNNFAIESGLSYSSKKYLPFG